jgi:outer membrane lipoprotein-sorting protein
MLTARLCAAFIVVLLAGGLVAASACSSSPTSPTSPELPNGISRERAIDIARQQVSFTPTSVDVATDTVQGQPTWAVTFRASDGSHGGLGQFMKVWVDRRSGEIVSLARS